MIQRPSGQECEDALKKRRPDIWEVTIALIIFVIIYLASKLIFEWVRGNV